MNFLSFIIYVFLIYETSLYLVKGQTMNAEKSDCTKLYDFLYGDTNKDYKDSCCTGFKEVTCDNEGFITVFSNSPNVKVSDLTSFPYLSRIEFLQIIDIGLKEIPNSILNLTSLKKLFLSVNNIGEIPPAIQNLSQLELLILGDNDIKELPNEVFNIKSLKTLNLGGNDIEVLPPAIQNLSSLEELYLDNNKLKELPREIFNLTHLKTLFLKNNPSLNTKMIRFGDSAIYDCDFNTINILCYEPFTCERIHFNGRDFMDVNAEQYFKSCTRDEINELRGQNVSSTNTTTNTNNNSDQNVTGANTTTTANNKGSSSSFLIVGGIILGCIVGIFIGILVTFMIIKKNKSKKYSKSDINADDEFRNESVKVKLNEKLNDDDDDDGNNNNMKDNNNNNNNESKKGENTVVNNSSRNNKGFNNNIQNNLNKNIIINSNGYNPNALPGMVVLINNPQNPGNYVLSNINMNANHNNIYPTSINKGDEPPPEYTEINK